MFKGVSVILEILEIRFALFSCGPGNIGNLKSPTVSVFLEILEMCLLAVPGVAFLGIEH